jgi:hypothetical protein
MRVPRTCRELGAPHCRSSSIVQIQRKIATAPAKLAIAKRKRRSVNGSGSRNNENGIAYQRNPHGPRGAITTEWRPQSPPTRHQRIQGSGDIRPTPGNGGVAPAGPASAKGERACIGFKKASLVYRRENTLQSCIKNSDTWLGSTACAPHDGAPDRPRPTRAPSKRHHPSFTPDRESGKLQGLMKPQLSAWRRLGVTSLIHEAYCRRLESQPCGLVSESTATLGRQRLPLCRLASRKQRTNCKEIRHLGLDEIEPRVAGI